MKTMFLKKRKKPLIIKVENISQNEEEKRVRKRKPLESSSNNNRNVHEEYAPQVKKRRPVITKVENLSPNVHLEINTSLNDDTKVQDKPEKEISAAQIESNKRKRTRNTRFNDYILEDY